MLYIDSSVFLYATLYSASTEQKSERAKAILQRIENGEIPAGTSTLTWDEVVWVTTRLLGRTDGVAQGRKLLGFPNLQFINADETVITQAQTLLDKYTLSPRDSIHVASALSRNAKTIISDDKDFDQIKELERTHI